MRKNLVNTARRIHSPEQKETIHMIFIFRREACSGSMHELAHIPTLNSLADCLTKASAKADILITAVKTGRHLDVDIHHVFYNNYGAQGLLIFLLQNIYFLPECPPDLPCTNSPRKTISRDVCGDSTYQGTQGTEYE